MQKAKQLPDENARLKKLVADLSSDKEKPKAVIRRTGIIDTVKKS